MLQSAIVDCARLFGWTVAYFRPAQTAKGWRTPVGADGKGWPDLCLVRDRVVFAELKVNGRKLEPAQEAWRDRILHAGGEWHLWTENEWEDGTVDRVLQP